MAARHAWVQCFDDYLVREKRLVERQNNQVAAVCMREYARESFVYQASNAVSSAYRKGKT
jgi:hypothetical protein